MERRGTGTRRLGSVRRRIDGWREEHGGRGQVIPGEIWEAAVEVARVEGVEVTARVLRLDRERLARRMSLSLAQGGSVVCGDDAAISDGSGGFVELEALGLCRAAAGTVVRFEGRDGERVQVELSGASAVDIVELGRAFWSRPR